MERFVVVPFSRDLSLLEPEDYVRDVLLGAVGMREIVIGYDHRFGRKARGDRALLERLGARLRVLGRRDPGADRGRRDRVVDRGPPPARSRPATPSGPGSCSAGRTGSSGTVVQGDQRGRTIGYPTANVRPGDPRKLVPALGVYAVRARLADGPRRRA